LKPPGKVAHSRALGPFRELFAGKFTRMSGMPCVAGAQDAWAAENPSFALNSAAQKKVVLQRRAA